MIYTEILQREFVYLWFYFTVLIRQLFPYWILGMVIGSFISVFLKNKIHSMLDKMCASRIGILGIVPACLIGIASPLCMYGTIPIAAAFAEKGIRDDWLAAFMTASVLLNPQLIVYSTALGTTAFVVRIVSCFACGCIAGVLVRLFYYGKPFFDFGGFSQTKSRDTDKNMFLRFLFSVGRNIKATGLYFLGGVVLAVVFQRYLPAEWITNLFGKKEAWGVLMAATIGVPLYACGGGTIPLLQQWLWNGMSMGSAGAFMITGPATKITNLGALKTVLGIKRFMLYIVYIALFSLVTGIIVNIIV